MLGLLYVKLAAEGEAQDWLTRMGGGAPAPTYGAGLPVTSGTSTIFGAASGIIGDADPDVGLVMNLLQPFLRDLLPKDIAEKLTQQQQRIATGAGTLAQSSQISNILMGANQSLMDQQAERLGRVLTGSADQVENPLAKKGLTWLANLATSHPKEAGKLVQMARTMQIPVLSPALNVLFRDVPLTYMPLVQASYDMGGDEQSPQVLEELLNNYNKAYSAGVFKDAEGNQLDASMAMAGFGLAAHSLGSRATLSDSVNLARAASYVTTAGLASNPQVAYEIVRQMGPEQVLRDLNGFATKMKTISARMQGASIGDKQSAMLKTLELSEKTGLPFEHGIANTLMQAEREKVFRQSGKTPQELSQIASLQQARQQADTEGFAQADTTRGLTAWAMETQEGNAALNEFLRNPSAEAASDMLTRARQSGAWYNRNNYNPSILRQKFGPEHFEAFATGEQLDLARELGGQQGSFYQMLQNRDQYKQLFEDPLSAPASMREQFASMPGYVRKQLMNPAVRAAFVNDYARRQVQAPRPAVLPDIQQFSPEEMEQMPKPAATPATPTQEGPDNVGPAPTPGKR